MKPAVSLPPCILYEDEHLLVVNKPAGLNTHAPGPCAGEGLYDWLKHRVPRWSSLAIIHRLDKETSGVMVFGKTPLANRSLTEQFTQRVIRKTYQLLTDRAFTQRERVVKSKIIRAGERYVSSPHGEAAETKFSLAADVKKLKRKFSDQRLRDGDDRETSHVGCYGVTAEPLTGRTHQIRVHAAESGFPILGDTLYGGTPAPRVCLHAAELTLHHPASGEVVTFRAPADFAADARQALRAALIEPELTDAFRLIHGASDGWPGWYLEQLANFLLSQSERELTVAQRDYLKRLPGVTGVYHKTLNRQVRRASVTEVSPQLVLGKATPERITIRENGLQFELSFSEGYSVGLFLDQRDNRRRLQTGHIAADFRLQTSDSKLEVLNAFAYTCAFSVCAAAAGARTTSLDLSKKYLDWGRQNFVLNGLDPAAHDFIYGDAFDWLRRLARKARLFDVVVLDPPTFSQSKEQGVFRAEKDYGRLVSLALPLLRPGGVLLASTNAADWPPEKFLATLEEPIRVARRQILQRHYAPQPPDFPVSREEPAYLKTVWLRIA